MINPRDIQESHYNPFILTDHMVVSESSYPQVNSSNLSLTEYENIQNVNFEAANDLNLTIILNSFLINQKNIFKNNP